MPDKALEKRRTIGIRIPGNAVPRAIVAALGCPLITTSVKDVTTERVIEFSPYIYPDGYVGPLVRAQYARRG